MIAERDSQPELEREIAAPVKPLSETALSDNGGESAEVSEKPDPTKIQPWYPPGEFAPTIYPEGWPDRSKRLGFKFKRIKIRGKPLSETVMEDRRAGW